MSVVRIHSEAKAKVAQLVEQQPIKSVSCYISSFSTAVVRYLDKIEVKSSNLLTSTNQHKELYEQRRPPKKTHNSISGI